MTNFDDFLAEVHTVAIGGHIRPDGDCVGSCLATYNYIKTWYPDIDVTVYLEPIPNIFKFMARSNEIVSDFPGIRYTICLSRRTAGIRDVWAVRRISLSRRSIPSVWITTSATRALHRTTTFSRRQVPRRSLSMNCFQRSASQRRLPSAFIPEWYMIPASSSIRVRRERRWRSPER